MWTLGLTGHTTNKQGSRGHGLPSPPPITQSPSAANSSAQAQIPPSSCPPRRPGQLEGLGDPKEGPTPLLQRGAQGTEQRHGRSLGRGRGRPEGVGWGPGAALGGAVPGPQPTPRKTHGMSSLTSLCRKPASRDTVRARRRMAQKHLWGTRPLHPESGLRRSQCHPPRPLHTPSSWDSLYPISAVHRGL